MSGDDYDDSLADRRVRIEEPIDLDDGFEFIDGFGMFSKKKTKVVDQKRWKFPEPVYPDEIDLGNQNSESRLDQVLEQLNIKRDDYVWWNQDHHIEVKIPNQLYDPTFQDLQKGNFNFSPRSVRERSNSRRKRGADRVNHGGSGPRGGASVFESVQTTPEPKILITKDTLYIFSLETEFDKINVTNQKYSPATKSNTNSVSDDITQERLDKINKTQEVKVCDVQFYHFFLFEFLQRMQKPKRSFIMSAYNLSSSQNENNQQLFFQCFDDNTLFILTHLIEKYLTAGW